MARLVRGSNGARERRSFSSAALLTSCLSAVSCHKEAPPPEATAASPGPSAPAATANGKPASSEVHEDTFDLAIRPVGAYSAGKAGTVEIVLSAKSGYHANDKYPYKLKTSDSPGVKYRTAVFSKDDVQLEPTRATMKVEFTPESAGEKTVGGQFSFSVCSAEHCLVDKRDLALSVRVD